MPITFRFDQVEGHRVRDSSQGVEIVRRCLVTQIPIDVGDSDPAVFLKIIKNAGCPGLGTAYPDTDFAFCKLDERNLVNAQRANNAAYVDFIYRGVTPTVGGTNIQYVLEDSHIAEESVTYSTANGSQNLIMWYKKGTPTSTTSIPAAPAYVKSVGVRRTRCSRVIRARGRASAALWSTIRDTIKGFRAHINSTPWGSDPRGTWMFMGPSTVYVAGYQTIEVQLDFLEGIDGHFPVAAFFNKFGDHPADCATEADIRSGGPPTVNTSKNRNGIMIASVQPEINFNSYFNFTP